jgi:hypothetical protein
MRARLLGLLVLLVALPGARAEADLITVLDVERSATVRARLGHTVYNTDTALDTSSAGHVELSAGASQCESSISGSCSPFAPIAGATAQQWSDVMLSLPSPDLPEILAYVQGWVGAGITCPFLALNCSAGLPQDASGELRFTLTFELASAGTFDFKVFESEGGNTIHVLEEVADDLTTAVRVVSTGSLVDDLFAPGDTGPLSPGFYRLILETDAAIVGPVEDPPPLGFQAMGRYGVALVVVPEPSSSLLFLAGLAGLAMRRRRA